MEGRDLPTNHREMTFTSTLWLHSSGWMDGTHYMMKKEDPGREANVQA